MARVTSRLPFIQINKKALKRDFIYKSRKIGFQAFIYIYFKSFDYSCQLKVSKQHLVQWLPYKFHIFWIINN